MIVIDEAAALLGSESLTIPARIYLSGLNREAWLEAYVEKLRGFFDGAGLELPPELYVSVGFPSKSALSRNRKRIGEHWNGGLSKDGKPHIFISPLLDVADVGQVLVHELVHAALPAGTKHGPKFKAAMHKVGLEGKATATVAGAELTLRLQDIEASLPPYPHSMLVPSEEEQKKQSTRMFKVYCPEHPDYIVRASRKVIDLGSPVCGLCIKDLQPMLQTRDVDDPPMMKAEGYEPGKSEDPPN